jgi:outer membrane biosynthesis protein TonB
MRNEASERYPALAASAALHAAVLLSGLIAWPWLSKPLQIGDVVPVTLVTSADVSNMREAVAAPTPAPAQTETPDVQAPPAASAPEPAPTPEPAPKAVQPPPRPAPTPARPAVSKPVSAMAKAAARPASAKPATSSFDPDALLASLAKPTKATGAPRSSAARGPSRPETAVVAQVAVGAGDAVSASALSALAGELQRLWNPNCDVEGGSDVNIKVGFRLDPSGRLIGPPESSQESASDPVVRAASDRAKRAVNQGAPFDSLPPALYGPKIVVNFNAKQACANR